MTKPRRRTKRNHGPLGWGPGGIDTPRRLPTRARIVAESSPSACERILRVEVRDPGSVRPLRVYDVATDARYTVIGGKHVRGCIGLVPGFNEERREVQEAIRTALAERAGAYAYQQPAPAPIPMPPQRGDAPWVQEGLFGGPPPAVSARRTKKNGPPISPATIGNALRSGGFREWNGPDAGFSVIHPVDTGGHTDLRSVYVFYVSHGTVAKAVAQAKKYAAHLRSLNLAVRRVQGGRVVLVEG